MAISTVTTGDLVTADKFNEVISAVSSSDLSMSFRNKIDNGGFDVWQRGTSQTVTGFGSDDRWGNGHTGYTKVHTREAFDPEQTEVPGYPKYYSRTVITGSGTYVAKGHRIEDVTTLAGRTVTFSFYGKANAAKNIVFDILQNFGSGGSSIAYTNAKTFSLTTAWARYTHTFTMPSVTGKTLGTTPYLELIFWLAGLHGPANTGTFDIAQVQLEEGSSATTFEQRPYELELLLCRRFFENGTFNWTMYQTGGSGCTVTTPFKVTKRAIPVMTVTSPGIINMTNPVLSATVNDFANAGTATATGTVVYNGYYSAAADL